ncbi:HipA domain-containing protein [Arcticibacter eurypsychrophilus]|uniref:HipA domain-containing protein n=1 Tax=Arcticibacter eurypsychrophilus TaxID=1434752 RepID=UPI001112EA9D|nr:HipA domain-containing protein [Arcticibacter eurypsychrophilus]
MGKRIVVMMFILHDNGWRLSPAFDMEAVILEVKNAVAKWKVMANETGIARSEQV